MRILSIDKVLDLSINSKYCSKTIKVYVENIYSKFIEINLSETNLKVNWFKNNEFSVKLSHKSIDEFLFINENYIELN